MDILDYICFFSGIIYTLVPAIFLYILQLKLFNEESPSILGILFMYSNAFIYFVLSACDSKEIQVMDFCNLAGAYLSLIYLFLYLKHLFYKTEKQKIFIFMSIIILTSVLVFLVEYFTKKEKSIKLIEWIGVIFNILEYLPIGFNLLYLIKNRVSNKFTLFSGFMGFINALIWLVWAITRLIKDNDKIHSLIANIFGILLSLLQIFIYYIFRNEISTINAVSTSENSEDGKKVYDNESNEKKKGEEPEIMEEFL